MKSMGMHTGQGCAYKGELRGREIECAWGRGGGIDPTFLYLALIK